MSEKETEADSTPDERRELDEARRARNGEDKAASGKNPGKKKENKGPEHGNAYEEYLYGRSILSTGSHKPNWASTTKGRIAIRMISRGIFGAAFFAWGTRVSRDQLKNYESDLEWSQLKGPLQYIAKGIDTVISPVIEKGAYAITRSEELAKGTVRFRPKNFYPDLVGTAPELYHSVSGKPLAKLDTGRSLGSEIVSVTFDFSSMSFGDGLARNIIQAFDPNLPQPWFKDKDGKATSRAQHGKFDVKEWGKSIGRAAWRITTKNAGEDWFAALPYVYQMKWQRQAIAKIPGFFVDDKVISHEDKDRSFKGFKLGSDFNNNGGSLKINEQGHVTGDYQLAGILDLQGRFVGYNVYTLMYRELYDTIGNALKKAHAGDLHVHFHMPKHPLAALVDNAAISARYVAKSVIKANLFMEPSVPFFWITRVPQSKRKSAFVLESAAANQNALGTFNSTKRGIERNESGEHSFIFREPMDIVWPNTKKPLTDGKIFFSEQMVPNPFPQNRMDQHGNPIPLTAAEQQLRNINGTGPFDPKSCKTITSKILNPFGWICYQSGEGLTKAASGLITKDPNAGGISGLINRNAALSTVADSIIGKVKVKDGKADYTDRDKFFRDYADAAWSYTPYFAAKDEFGLRVNDTPADGSVGKMDKTIYDFIDNVATFRFGKAAHSFGNIMHLATHLDKEVKSAEGTVAKSKWAEENRRTTTTPSTKVQATTVQYNTTPPTHLAHKTAEEAKKDAQAPTNAQKKDDESKDNTRWAESVTSRKLAEVFPTGQPTVH